MLLNKNAPAAFTPEQVADLVVRPVLEASVASQVSTIVRTGSAQFRIPVVGADVAAEWVEEGEEITPSDPNLGEIIVTPAKVAALTILSNELASDGSPEAAAMVGDSIARDLARKIDLAFFGDLDAPAPPGLGGLTNVTELAAGATVTNLDVFAEALAVAEAASTAITAWVAHPDDALKLSQLKEATGSARPLLQPDATAPTRRLIQGVELFSSPAVEEGTIWGLPKTRVLLVVRQDTTLAVDASPFFTSDRTAVRGTMRIGFGFTDQTAIAKIVLSGS